MTREEIKDFCDMKAQLEPENEDIYKAIVKALEQELTTKNDLGDDCVRRKAVLNTLERMDKVLDEDRTVDSYKELLKECYKVLPSVTPQDPNWIKCSEHLPNFDVDVLATTKEYGDVVKVTRWRTILKDCGWEWVLVDDTEGNVYNSDEIIAWMPLPEPYKAESEDKG
jgi:hypothetical protein